MGNILSTIRGFFVYGPSRPDTFSNYNEKQTIAARQNKPRTTDEIATDVVNTLLMAEKPGRNLKIVLDDKVRECGWIEHLAETILNVLAAAIKAGVQMGQAMKEAVGKATKDAYEWAKEHPLLVTIIALGVLVILFPWAIEALGFGELGPAAGSFAARWQSLYGGCTPGGSLFSFLQRMGMIWSH